jgi:Protein of unknown function (DUF1566)
MYRNILIVALVGVQSVFGQTASLLVRTDLECRWSVDGESRGILSTGDGVRVSLSLGEHRIEAVPVAGGPHWEDTVDLAEQPEGKVLTIALKAAVAFAEAQSRGYWIDPNTKLMWAAADNGSGVSQSQAAYYCRFLMLSGYRDWTLPSIDDLQQLVGGPANDNGYRIVGPLKLTGWAWSSSPGKEPGEQWALDFGDGGRASVVTGDSGLNRALCVRHAKE